MPAPNTPLTHRRRPKSALPDLELGEIKQELHRLAIELPVSFWTEPSRDDVWHLYARALELILAVSTDKLRQEEMTGQVAYGGEELLPERGRRHFAAIGLLRMHRYMQRLSECLLLSDLYDLTMLHSPDPRFVYYFTCSFVNYMRFRDSQCERYMPKIETIHRREEEVQQMERETAGMEEAVDELETTAKESEKELQSQRKLEMDLSTKLKIGNDRHKLLQSELAIVTSQNAKLEHDIHNNEFDVASMMTRKEEIEGQIVKSPRRLIKEATSLRSDISAETLKLQTSVQNTDYFRTKIAVLEKGQMKMEKTRAFMASMGAMLETTRQLQERMTHLDASRAELKGERNAAIVSRDKARKALEILQDAHQSLKHDVDIELTAARDRLRGCEEELRKREEELKEKREQTEMFKKEMSCLSASMDCDRDDFHDHLHCFSQHQERILEALQGYQERLLERLTEFEIEGGWMQFKGSIQVVDGDTASNWTADEKSWTALLQAHESQVPRWRKSRRRSILESVSELKSMLSTFGARETDQETGKLENISKETDWCRVTDDGPPLSFRGFTPFQKHRFQKSADTTRRDSRVRDENDEPNGESKAVDDDSWIAPNETTMPKSETTMPLSGLQELNRSSISPEKTAGIFSDERPIQPLLDMSIYDMGSSTNQTSHSYQCQSAKSNRPSSRDSIASRNKQGVMPCLRLSLQSTTNQ